MFDHFDFLAPIYDRFIGTAEPTQLQSVLDVPAGGRVLDAGGGTGRVTTFLRSVAAEVVLLDQSLPMLQQAQAKGLDPLRGDVARMPFSNASFDRVVVVDAFHHFMQPHKALGDLLRVLKPGGRLVIEEPDIRLGAVKVVAFIEWAAMMGSHFFTPDEMCAMVAVYGATARVESDGRFSVWVIADKPL